METPLLATKLVIPPLRLPLLPRLRLLERLAEGLDYNLVLVSAPAGFGKTTLLSDWVRHAEPKMPAAWLSLDEADNDPVRFWDYFIAALKILQPTFGESTLALLHSSQPSPVETLMTVLINELAVISSRFVLVLDDYHLITAKPVHDGITYLLDHLPAQMHLVIGTRADPPMALAHLRGKGMMLEVRTDDLRFRRDEAIALLEAMKISGLSTADAANLDNHTQGWAVGLKMAALAMQRQPAVAEFIANFTGSQRYIMDYLMEEVMQRQSKEVGDFLLETSVLERLTAPLCDAVTGRSDSDDMLLKLEHGNLFIAPLDESRQWYRYDHLFLDLLRHQAEARFGAEHVAELHRRASQWHEKDYPDDAIHHALRAQDWETAARLVHEHLLEKRRQAQWVTLLNWLQRIPEDIMHRDLELCRVYGSTLISMGQLDAASAITDYLEQAGKGDDILRGYVGSLRSRIAYGRGNVRRALELGEEALKLLPADADDARSGLSHSLGYWHWQRGQFLKAEPLLTESYEAGRRAGNDHLAAAALVLLAAAETSTTGRLRRPFERYQQAIKLAGPTPATYSSHQGLGWTLYELNELDEAARETQRALELGRLTGMGLFVARQYCLLAQCGLARGDKDAAMKELENACLIAHSIDRPDARAEHAAYHITIALLQDDLSTASEWGRKLAGDADALPFYLSHVPPRLLIAQGDKPRAAEQLRAMSEENTKGVAHHHVVVLRLYRALAADTTESAMGFLADVLALTEPEGYIRTYVDEGRHVAPLLRQAVSRGISRDYASKLLTIIEAEERQKRATKKEQGAPSPARALLTERELEVLRLLSEGLSNQHIAARLTVSSNTAKTHIRHILEKLNSRSRLQAIARAKELQLIS